MNPLTVDSLDSSDWQTLRDVRLAALGDSPHAFWAKLSDESRYSEAEWVLFLEGVAWFVARRDGSVKGMAGMTRTSESNPQLIGMWVDPSERGRGVGALLTLAVLDFARGRGASSVGLWVTEGNDAARAMYTRLGFRFTGEWAPMPHDAASGEHLMTITLGGDG